MYFVYVLKSLKYSKSYIGHTNDLQRRLIEHNSGYSLHTSKFKPWMIIYSEEYLTEKEAIDKEKYYKSHAGRNKLIVIFNNCGIV
jgi:putative endonuclease